MFSASTTYEKQLKIEKTRLSHQVWSHGGSTYKKKDIKRPFFPPCRNWPIWKQHLSKRAFPLHRQILWMNLWKGKLPKKWYFLGLYPKLWPKTKNTHFGKLRTPGPPTPYLGPSPIKYHLFYGSFPNHPSDLCKKMEEAWKDEGAFLKVVYHVLKTWKDCMNDLPSSVRKRALVSTQLLIRARSYQNCTSALFQLWLLLRRGWYDSGF